VKIHTEKTELIESLKRENEDLKSVNESLKWNHSEQMKIIEKLSHDLSACEMITEENDFLRTYILSQGLQRPERN
jgi:hypothetical protein